MKEIDSVLNSQQILSIIDSVLAEILQEVLRNWKRELDLPKVGNAFELLQCLSLQSL